MKISRFNETGLARFNEFLDSLTTDSPSPYPEDLLTDPAASVEVSPAVEVEPREFANRFEAAEYLHERLGDAGIPELERDRGLWAWLACFYFDQLCPEDNAGKRKPGQRARWIPATGDFRKYYRHLLSGPFRIFRAHRERPERALALLSSPLYRPGDVVEQLASRQEVVTNPAFVEAATLLYIDATTQKPKRGAAGRGRASARRLADVHDHFDVTWDLYAMKAEDLIAMLPDEFDRFRPSAS